MKTKYCCFLIVCLSLCFANNVCCQIINDSSLIRLFGSQNTWAVMNLSEESINWGEHPYNLKIGVSRNDTLKLIKKENDEYGFTHLTFQQYYKNIPVDNAILKMHYKDDSFVICNGRIIDSIEIPIDNALINSTSLKIKDALDIDDSSLCLVITRTNDLRDFTASNMQLSYKYDDFSGKTKYYNAFDGGLIKETPSVYNIGDITSSVNTWYNGNQYFQVYQGLLNERLEDRTRGDGIMSYTAHGMYSPAIIKSTNWNIHPEKKYASAHWAMEKTYDYYLHTFNRDSYDNTGHKITIYQCDSIYSLYNYNQLVKAQWNRSREVFEIGPEITEVSGPFVSLDVIGHEYTHAVVSSTANFDVIGEPAALNESFADIFGTMVEFSVEGDAGDYFLGEDFWIADGKLRDMKDPKSKQHPDTYQGQYWTDSGDYIHINCGVQNKWFYLLAEGGSGTNDNNVVYSVSGIGRDKAAQIAFRNMVYYLSSTSTFADAKNGAIMSAIDLFGIQSNEVLQTILAWDAVGVSWTSGIYNYIDMSADCSNYSNMHNNGIPVTVYCVGEMHSNCAFSPNNIPVVFAAGGDIILEDGFESGNNFVATPISSVTPRRASNSTTSVTVGTESNRLYDIELNSETVKTTTSLYPNPTSSHVVLEAPEKIALLILFNSNGTVVYEESFTETNKININMTDYISGLYFAKIILKNGQVLTKKISKK